MSTRSGTARGGADRSTPIAIVGMSGRFPGADDLDDFWQNLAAGVESITELSADEVRAAGVPDDLSRLPGFVRAAPLLGDVDRFDAGFFGYSARDAALTDPQHRLFLETAWQALEDAGYDPAAYPRPIGVFGGCEMSTYLYQLSQNVEALGYVDGMQLMVTNDKDHLCTQVSYRLNLRGPSIVVQTTCSTSLVAVAVACESLRGGSCDMALAGGVTVRVPQRAGYFYAPGSILSPDGHCRPFDARAQGTVVGSGVGIVVLKRLDDAIADGDSIRAVILSVGLNNDGSDKVGYTAPGVRGQVAAITAAYEQAGVSPDTVGYVEAHGTGTILGDPIELSALTQVFRAHTDRRGFCGIGSLKANVGHLSCASGVAGLIKTVLALEHRAIPPTVHYQSPNPAIDFAASPFYVTTSLHPWSRNGSPRRAAISSFGIGGTNAHAVLEEAPTPPAPATADPEQILTISARSAEAAATMVDRLHDRLECNRDVDLADVAFTLHAGRREFRHRRAFVVRHGDLDGALQALREPGGPSESSADAQVVFMFPGQGAQYPGMGRELYETQDVVRDAVDRCCARLETEMDLDLRDVLFPDGARAERAAAELRDTALAQPALFVIEYAVAQLWRSWGIEPTAMIGHSIGEYVAATLAGVLTVDDALHLLAHRGRLISALPSGSMLAVMAPPSAVEDMIDDDVSLAAINAPALCVLSGPTPVIQRVETALQVRSVPARRLHTSHAFHSSMMDPMLDEFEGLVRQITLSAPSIPYVATLSGQWADGDVVQASYWSRQIRSAVRFADGLTALASPTGVLRPGAVLLEVGPGRALSTFATQVSSAHPEMWSVAASLPAAEEDRSAAEVARTSLARMWERGVAVDWSAYHRGERRRRVSLPTYPFERESYWIGTPVRPVPLAASARDVSAWFSRPAWSRRDCPEAAVDLADQPVLVLDDGCGLGEAVVAALRACGAVPITAAAGEHFEVVGEDSFRVVPGDPDSFGELVAALPLRSRRLAGVIDCWGTTPPGSTDLDEAARRLLLTPVVLSLALGRVAVARPLPVLLAARGTDRVTDDDVIDAARAFGRGVAKVIPQEHSGLRFAHVDVDITPATADRLVDELRARLPEPEVAIRDGARLVRTYDALTVPPVGAHDLGERPVVLITGGVGHMGLILAAAAYREMGARLVLIGRTATLEPERLRTLADLGDDAAGLLDALRRWGDGEAVDDVLILGADLDDGAAVARAVDAAVAAFGRIDVVVHGAANVSDAAFGLVADTGPKIVAAQMSPKLRGLVHLQAALEDRPVRWVVHSSISSVLGGMGLAAYAGANAVLDAIVDAGGPGWLSIVWDAWDNAGEAQTAAISAIQPAEGQEAFLRLMGVPTGRVVVSTQDLEGRIEAWVRRGPTASTTTSTDAGARHARPSLATAYVEPRTDTERALADIWASQLGLDRVGVHDRFFDLGGHSLLAVQITSEIRDRFDIDLPVPELFKAPTVGELAVLVDGAGESIVADDVRRHADRAGAPHGDDSENALVGEGPGLAAKESYRAFYDDISRRLAATGMADASFFLNYGYVSSGNGDDAIVDVPAASFNANSIRLAFELIGRTDLRGRDVLDVGCGRGGTAALLVETFGAHATGVDLSPEAVAFCRRTHRHADLRFEVGDAEHLPCGDAEFDAVTNVESSHTYPDLRAFLGEVRRVVRPGGWFLHTDLLPGARWDEVRVLLDVLGFVTEADRDITANVLASCDAVAAGRVDAFGDHSAMIDNFLAVPGSPVYEQMASQAWQYRIRRSRLAQVPAEHVPPGRLCSLEARHAGGDVGFFSDIGLGFLEGGGGSSASVSSTINMNVNGLDKIHETIELAGSTTVNQHLTVDPVTLNENIDLKPVTLNENIDLKPVTLNENIDLKPVTLNENIDLKPVTLNENIDLKPVAVDTCQTFRLAPLPDTNVCQPYRHHVSYTMFGIEQWAVTYDGESIQRIVSPRHPQVVTRVEHPDHTFGGRVASVTGQGIRVRVLDDDET